MKPLTPINEMKEVFGSNYDDYKKVYDTLCNLDDGQGSPGGLIQLWIEIETLSMNKIEEALEALWEADCIRKLEN